MEKETLKGTVKSVDWEKYRKEFPITENMIYMNNAAVSPPSTRVLDAINETARKYSLQGTTCREEIVLEEMNTRKAVADLINAAPEEIAFIKNTTQGILIAANGIRWREGENVVLPFGEFPANVYPWLSLKERGVETRLVEPKDGVVTADMLIEASDEKTRAISVSAIQFSTGYRIDLDKLGAFTREHGIYFHVDGIQAVGMIDLDVKRYGIDFLSTGGQKWLLAVSGTGFFYCRKEIIEELNLWNPGWVGVEDPWAFTDYGQSYKRDAGRFEEGSKNVLGIAALGASVARFLEIGMPAVEEKVISMTDELEEKLRSMGFKITSPRGEGEKSGIICFQSEKIEAEKIFDSLKAGNVVTSLRLGNIRVSPHFYNNASDIEGFIKALEKL